MLYGRGQIIQARYEVLYPLPEGGMGEVYAVKDQRLGRTVALKVVKDAGDDEAIQRFVEEWRVLARIDHPNILSLYDAGQDGGRWFFTTQLLKGKTFEEWIDEGPHPWREVAKVGLELTQGLEAVHAEMIVHGDIKPANVFLTDRRHVKLLDFGIAATSTQSLAGKARFFTPGFASPEQLRYEDLDARSDIFSFGVLLHLLASGVHPFDYNPFGIMGSTPAHVLSSTSATSDFVALVRRCLEKKRSDRFATVREVGDAIRHALAGPTIEIISSAQLVGETGDAERGDGEHGDGEHGRHPYRRTVAMIVRDIVDSRLVRPSLWYVPGPPLMLNGEVLKDVGAHVQKERMVVTISVNEPIANVASFFPRVRQQLERLGIRSASADPEDVRSAIEMHDRRVLILLDAYYHYFHTVDGNREAVAAWASGIEVLCERRTAAVVMAGSVDPRHMYPGRGPGSLPLRVIAARLDPSWEEWYQDLAATYEVDSDAVAELRHLAEDHAGALRDGVEALRTGRPPEPAIRDTLEMAGEGAKSVLPECCWNTLKRTAMKQAADKRCLRVLEESGFLLSVNGSYAPAVSSWRHTWTETD